MKILYLSTSFPKPSSGATIYTDLAEALHEAGHDITTVVSEQSTNIGNMSINKERGFDVLRIVTGNSFAKGLVEKGITVLRMPFLMKRGITKYLNNMQFDFILFEGPTNPSLANWAKKKFNCKSYLMLKDIFPQNAADLGIMKKSSILYKYFKAQEKKLYETADLIGCMSDANRKYILEHNKYIKEEKVEIFPNTKKFSYNYEAENFLIRQRYGIPQNVCVFIFGGNMGKPQYIDLLCYAVKQCKDEKNAFFLFVGRGTDRYKLENTIKDNNICNAIAIQNLPRDEYEQIIKECDVGLIVLDPRFTIPNYPSRILSYMEYAKPVLAATDNETDIKALIESAQCGEWVCSQNSEAFVEKIKGMAKNEELSIMGLNGRKHAEENFSVECSVKILEKHQSFLEKLV